ncbi:hypothetical protein DSO57_1011826 [Entomophthora muscae]|uniref:Uncharacterized protein n=1 Tax=Entomophthora muscae TaxID=34485 RepID=A0ACC2URT2_9FUNG|nr:hypothetical protein DSO57_1011826 [Entomophthora muscae]
MPVPVQLGVSANETRFTCPLKNLDSPVCLGETTVRLVTHLLSIQDRAAPTDPRYLCPPHLGTSLML